MSSFNPKEFVSIDTETTGLFHYLGDRPFAVSMCDEDGGTACWEFDVDPFTRKVIHRKRYLDEIREVVEDPNLTKIMHHMKFDYRMILAGLDMATAGTIHDTMVAARVCNSIEDEIGLKPLAIKYLDYDDTDLKELKKVLNRTRQRARKLGWMMGTADGGEDDYWMLREMNRNSKFLRTYALRDAERTMLLWMMYREWMAQDDMEETYEMEMELQWMVMRMENRGAGINKPVLNSEYNKALLEAAKSKRKLQRYVEDILPGRFPRNSRYEERVRILKSGKKSVKTVCVQKAKPFNPNSSQHVVPVLKHLGVPIEKTTKTGQMATDIKAVIPYKTRFPFIRDLLHYKAQEKVSGDTFFQKYLTLLDEDSIVPGWHCLHPNFNPVGTVTGRFSCSNPNLQQTTDSESSRTSEDVSVRVPFGPRPGYYWFGIDYAQMEIKVFAEVSQEPFLMDAIANNRDIHSECGNKAWGGRNNLAGTDLVVRSLELMTEEPTTEEIGAVWKEFDWDFGLAPEDRSYEDACYIANTWLDQFHYDVVKAEKAFGKKVARTRAKILVFAKIYGGGPDAVMELMQVDRADAKQFLAEYDVAFPGIQEYSRALSKIAVRDGGIRNLYGRFLRVDPYFAYRCVNYLVQGTCADMMKRAMLRTDNYLRQVKVKDNGRRVPIDAHAILTLHDELIFEIKREHAYNWVLRGLSEIMTDTRDIMQIPMNVDIERMDESWAHKIAIEIAA